MGSWKIAVRSLARRPAFTLLVLGLLIWGIGANTALFSVVDTVLLKPLPYPDSGQLLSLAEVSPSRNELLIAPGRLEDWNRLNHTFVAVSGAYSENVTDTSTGEPVRLAGLRVAPRYFSVYGSAPLVGRTFTADEEVAGGRLTAVISYGLWSRGRAVGSRLVIGGQGITIVGVMPKTFTSSAVDVWLPAQIPAFLLQARDARFFGGVGRMKPGVTLTQALGDLKRVQSALGEEFPKTDKGWSVQVQNLKEARMGDSRRALLLLFGAVGLLLLIAVTNIAILFLAELQLRGREMAIRASIGASRAQVVGEVMRETAVIALVGAVGGWGAAVGSARLLAKAFADVPRMNELQVDWRALAFSIVVSLAGAFLFGLLPALQATNSKAAGNLFRAGRGVVGSRQWLQRVLLTGQIAATVLLLSSAAMLFRSFSALSRVDMGFQAENTLVFHVGASWDEDRTRVGALQERLISGLERLPGVEAAGITNFLPASGATMRYAKKLEGAVEGKVMAGERTVSPGYLRAIRVPLLKGKWCPELRNTPQTPPSVMVNRQFADAYGQGQDLVGRRLEGMEILGILGNIKEDSLNSDAYPYVYNCAMGGNWPDPEYVVRGSGDLRGAVRKLVKNVDPARVVFAMKDLREAVDGDLERPRANVRMVALFAGSAMLLAAIGIYGLVSQMVQSQRREIGVRMALGAEPGWILWSVVGPALGLAVVGAMVGFGLTFAARRTLESLLYGVKATDGWSLAAAAGMLIAVTLLAAWIPARRAAGIDPVEAIRAD